MRRKVAIVVALMSFSACSSHGGQCGPTTPKLDVGESSKVKVNVAKYPTGYSVSGVDADNRLLGMPPVSSDPNVYKGTQAPAAGAGTYEGRVTKIGKHDYTLTIGDESWQLQVHFCV